MSRSPPGDPRRSGAERRPQRGLRLRSVAGRRGSGAAQHPSGAGRGRWPKAAPVEVVTEQLGWIWLDNVNVVDKCNQ